MLHWLLVAGVTAWRHVYHNLALFVLPAMMNNGESGCWSQPGVIMYCNENNDEDTTHSAQCSAICCRAGNKISREFHNIETFGESPAMHFQKVEGPSIRAPHLPIF